PNADRPYNMRGIAYYKQGKFPEAITDYSKAIELQNWYALANRGIVYQEQGNKEKAIADFKMSIEKLPDVSDGWYQLAVVYKKDGEYDAALQHIQKALSMDTDRPHYHAVYAGLLIQTYKYAEALNQADQIFKIDPQNPDGFILKSTALHSLKRYDEAVDLITKGISVYPDNYLMYMIRALVYDLQGKTALAAADNEKAKQLGTK
ncbi:MAG: tetratricopeptide repeat protein, partial [Sphingobacteriaceae bacterium]